MDLAASLKKIPHLSAIIAIAQKHNTGVWLVGGFLRDSFLNSNKVLNDFDFCVEKNAQAVAGDFARSLGLRYIVLDEEQETLRVVLQRKNIQYHFDFSRLRAPTLQEDLRLRDFTINTLSVDLRARRRTLLDLLDARADLRRKLIRAPSEEVMAQDPIRILRGFAFSAAYGFRIEPKTLLLMEESRHLLESCAGERIAQELFKLFSCGQSYKAVKQMDCLGIIDEILPFLAQTKGVAQGAYHHLDVWRHSLETLRQFELFYEKKLKYHGEIVSYLNEEVAQGRTRMQLIKFACLLHDIGKPLAKKKLKKRTIFYEHEKIGRDMAAEIAEKLRLSAKEKDVLKKLIFWHLRPGYLADQITPSRRALYHYFNDTQAEGISVILLSLSDWRATRGPMTSAFKRRRHERVMFNILLNHMQEQKNKPLPRLVDGNDIMKRFRLESGPLIGVILRKIRQEQALAKITTKAQAYKIANAIVRTAKRRNRAKPPHAFAWGTRKDTL